MFAAIAPRYDAANHLLSGGIDVLWRRALVGSVAARHPRVVCDLATGSGDVAFALKKRLGPDVQVDGYDFCPPMLDEARRKQQALTRPQGLDTIRFAVGDCLRLPLDDASADALTIAFGLRNLEDRARGLGEMLRVLRPGGTLHILEFTQPQRWLQPFYFPFLQHIMIPFAEIVTSQPDAYQYLHDTIAGFPPREEISAELTLAGFTVTEARPLTGGIVALHVAAKPAG